MPAVPASGYNARAEIGSASLTNGEGARTKQSP